METLFKEDCLEAVKNYVYCRALTDKKYVSERSLAEKFNLKRNSSREILLSMEGEGIVERIPQKGYRLIDYRKTSIESIWAMRSAIESAACREAMELATREDILRIIMAYEDMEKFVEKNEYENFFITDIDFHRNIILAAHDNMLIHMFNFINTPVFENKIPAQKTLHFTNECHKLMVDAFKNRDMKLAEKFIKSHYGGFLLQYNKPGK